MRWRADRYTGLRNAAWLLRNARTGYGDNPLALAVVLGEGKSLISNGEPLCDVLKAFAELLVRP